MVPGFRVPHEFVRGPGGNHEYLRRICAALIGIHFAHELEGRYVILAVSQILLFFSFYSLVFVGRDELTSSQLICSFLGILNDPPHTYNKKRERRV